jgi:cyclophilin family peptidyl-prolyl cis-trans isomerase
MTKKLSLTLGIASLLVVVGCSHVVPTEDSFNENTAQVQEDTSVNEKLTINTTPTTMQFDASKHYKAILTTTEGEIEIELNFGQTPNTVKNFVDLANKNFYDNTIFHRVLSGFMIQGGDPQGTGGGGPGYTFDDEPFTGEYTRGIVAMANAGPNTNGSQFFIMHADYALPKSYTIFGKVIKGIEVVDKIAGAAVQVSPTGEPSVPVSPVTVTDVVINEQ